MSNLSLINMGIEYVVLAGMLLVFCFLAFVLAYLLILRGRCNKIQPKHVFRFIMLGSFFVYLFVVLGATLIRGSYSVESIAYWHLFSSYKQAWISASYTEWRNLILNILMFVPLGIYLPVIFKGLDKAYKVYGVGFVLSLSIELLQYAMNKGIAEIDDLFNNTLGTIIGYGIYVMIYTLIARNKAEGRRNIKVAMGLQIPLLVTVLSFGMLYVSYQKQEFGNLNCQATHTIKMKDVNVIANYDLSEVNEMASVYEISSYTSEELQVMGNDILAGFHTQIDEKETIIYENTVVLKSQDDSISLWLDYKGGTYWLTNGSVYDEVVDETLSEENVKDILLSYGIQVTEEAIYQADTQEGYMFVVDNIANEERLLKGYLSWNITTQGNVQSIHNYICEYTYVSDKMLYSEEEIYENMVNGEFAFYGVYKLEDVDIHITSMEVTYYIDSKGFYQPVYEVNVLIDNQADTIYMPALKKV